MNKVQSYINKGLPSQITSYDLLKSFAIITMIIDHIGGYLYPEVNEFRVIGRFSMPVWLFLVGYATSRDLTWPIWLGGFLLVGLDLVLGNGLFDLNILFTIIFARLSLDFLMRGFLSSRDMAVFVTVMLIILVFPSSYFFDYGTHAFLFAMFGYLVRHKEKIQFTHFNLLIFLGVITAARAYKQMLVQPFTNLENIVATLGIFLIGYGLIYFKPQTYDFSNVALSNTLKNIVKIMGRRSLEIYVLHLFMLKIVGFYKFPEKYDFLGFSFF